MSHYLIQVAYTPEAWSALLRNPHDRVSALTPVLQKLGGRFEATYFAFGSPPGLFDSAELVNDIHGGEVETSLMLHLAPELVHKRELADFRGLPHELAAKNRIAKAR